MSPAATAAPKGKSTVLDAYQQIFGQDGFLDTHNVERREEIELLGLATISGVDVLYLGDPGVGKTWMIELLVKECLSGMELFNHLLAKDMSADEVLGPRDIMAMKAGKISRLTEGYMPTANYAYLDEIFKASPPMLNPLLDLLANRLLKVGGQTVDCGQLLAIFMSSNELPDREDLAAFRDRIGITKFVQPVRTPEGRRTVTDLMLDYQSGGIDTTGLTPLTLADIKIIREQVRQVKVPDSIRETMGIAQQKWLEASHPPSQRRIGQMWKVIKARSWANGRSSVIADDLLPCQHMAWNHPDNAASARDVILEFASVFTRKATQLREAFEPIEREVQDLRSSLEGADEKTKEELMDDGFKIMRNLRKLKKKAGEQVAEGEKQGQDVTMLREVAVEIDKAHDWSEKVLSGTDE
jgi:MoxR-like ATPase